MITRRNIHTIKEMIMQRISSKIRTVSFVTTTTTLTNKCNNKKNCDNKKLLP